MEIQENDRMSNGDSHGRRPDSRFNGAIRMQDMKYQGRQMQVRTKNLSIHADKKLGIEKPGIQTDESKLQS